MKNSVEQLTFDSGWRFLVENGAVVAAAAVGGQVEVLQRQTVG